ncbi:hypothetical protein ACGFNU_24300 [Spirillospora sp. NPDC048911]|uniref:hypothetical protein n=1 Tax=Spirillospora sp. NPDC048911 TaxID=3364527 RepID=UPI00371A6C73
MEVEPVKNLPSDVGPYETAEQAAETVREFYQLSRLGPRGTLAKCNQERLLAACEAAGVELGDYDQRILAWLTIWEPETVAVIVGLVLRAHAGEVTSE